MVWLLFVIILALRKIPQDDFTAIFIDLFNRNMGGGKGKRELQKSSTEVLNCFASTGGVYGCNTQKSNHGFLPQRLHRYEVKV